MENKVNLLASIFNLCNTRITFRQNYCSDAVTIAESLMFPYIDFTPLMHTQERFNGYGYALSPSFAQSTGQSVGLGITMSRSRQEGRSRSRTRSASTTIGRSWNSQASMSLAEARTWMRSAHVSHSRATTDVESMALTNGSAEGEATTNSHAQGTQETQSNVSGASVQFPIASEYEQRRTENASGTHANGTSDISTVGSTINRQKSSSETVGNSHAEQCGEVRGNALGRGGGLTKTEGVSLGNGGSIAKTEGESVTDSHSLVLGTTQSLSRNLSESESQSVTFSYSPLALPPKVVEQESGKLQRATADQFMRGAAVIGNLPKRHCLVSVRDFNAVFTLRVSDVFDPFEFAGCPETIRKECIASFVSDMMGYHDCFYRPSPEGADDKAPEKDRDAKADDARPENVLFR